MYEWQYIKLNIKRIWFRCAKGIEQIKVYSLMYNDDCNIMITIITAKYNL